MVPATNGWIVRWWEETYIPAPSAYQEGHTHCEGKKAVFDMKDGKKALAFLTQMGTASGEIQTNATKVLKKVG